MPKIPVTVITGFLGSGKTTLLNRALHDPKLSKTVVIVNEFGEIGLDHELIEASNDAVVLLPNGCLCCSIRGDLVLTLVDLYQKRLKGELPEFDHVVVETSGLAEPSPILEVLNSETSVKSCYVPTGVITTFDAINGLDTLDAHEQSVRQVALADWIVVTKTDLVPEWDELATRLHFMNPSAQIVEAVNIDAATLFDLTSAAAKDDWTPGDETPLAPAASRSFHGHVSRINRFAIVRDEPWDRPTLQLFLDALATNAGPSLLRVKGIVALRESPERPAVVHGAQQLVHNVAWLERWPSEDRRTRIVFITFDWTAEQIQELTEDIERLAGRTRAARAKAEAAA